MEQEVNPFSILEDKEDSDSDSSVNVEEILGLQKPENMSTTDFKNYTATLFQLMMLDKEQLDIIAKSYGFSQDIHRIHSDPKELEKVAKVIVAADRREQGPCGSKAEQKPQPKRKVVPWSEDERRAIQMHFANFIELGKVPNKQDCEEIMEKDLRLQRRTWRNVKYQVYNIIQSGNSSGKVVPWSEDERRAIQMHFANFIELGKVPNKQDCEEIMEKDLRLQRRTWRNVKYQVYNIIQSGNSSGKECEKVPWTADETAAILTHFAHAIEHQQVPNMENCLKVMKKDNRLQRRTWRAIKYKVYNIILKNKKSKWRQ